MRTLKSIVPQRAKTKIKLLLNSEHLSLSAVPAFFLPRWFGTRHRRSTFQAIYNQKKWGDAGDGARFYSGSGSRGNAVTEYANQLAGLIGEQFSFEKSIKVVDLEQIPLDFTHSLRA